MGSSVQKASELLQEVFEENPNYSFGDPGIMVQHSQMVCDLSLQIAKYIECDEELLQVMALWHDIGKAYKTGQQTLRERHGELGYEVAKNVVSELGFSPEQIEKLTLFLKGDPMSFVEAQITKDADIIAFFIDEKLQGALKKWADEQGLLDELQRKADKVSKLRFEISKKLAERPLKKMKERWQLR